MKRRIGVWAALVALAMTGAAGQQAGKPATAPRGMAATQPAQGGAPQLTELERLKLENLQLKSTLLAQQQQSLQAQYGALIQAIGAEHPGYTWNPTANALVLLPKPTPTPAKPGAGVPAAALPKPPPATAPARK